MSRIPLEHQCSLYSVTECSAISPHQDSLVIFSFECQCRRPLWPQLQTKKTILLAIRKRPLQMLPVLRVSPLQRSWLLQSGDNCPVIRQQLDRGFFWEMCIHPSTSFSTAERKSAFPLRVWRMDYHRGVETVGLYELLSQFYMEYDKFVARPCCACSTC